MRHTEWPSSAFSADATTLASVGRDKSVALWDVTTGKLKKQVRVQSQSGIRLEGPFTMAALSQDLKSLAWQQYETKQMHAGVRIMDVNSGEECPPGEFLGGPVFAIALTPDGQSLATVSGDQTVHVTSIASGKEAFHSLADSVPGVIRTMVFSPDGKALAIARLTGSVELWDVPSGQRRRVVRCPLPPREPAALQNDLFLTDSLDGAACLFFRWSNTRFRPHRQQRGPPH